MPADEYLEPHTADQLYELDLGAYKGVVVESLVLPIVPLILAHVFGSSNLLPANQTPPSKSLD